LTLDGDIATGYAHTPVGALIAAANISTRYFLALDLNYRQAAEAMVAPGVGRDVWIALRAKESHPTADPAGTYAQIAVRGHEKVPTGGQVWVPAGGQVEVPAPRVSCPG